MFPKEKSKDVKSNDLVDQFRDSPRPIYLEMWYLKIFEHFLMPMHHHVENTYLFLFLTEHFFISIDNSFCRKNCFDKFRYYFFWGLIKYYICT